MTSWGGRGAKTTGSDPSETERERRMTKGRLEAFSDGVIAILITIMVLELKIPAGEGFAALSPVVPHLLHYLMSFVYLGLSWANPPPLSPLVRRVNGAILWANLHLLFWLSLFPAVTGWV